MLTPQEIQSKEFTKAVFGGYDMTAVDDFLEEMQESYAALYKENAVLKSKIKVLVEKVEEYRSTEDAMRMALLTAQKMSDDIVQEAQKKHDGLIAEAEAKVGKMQSSLSSEYAAEEAKIAAAKEKTVKFIEAARAIMAEHEAFLSRLDEVTGATAYVKKQVPAAETEPSRSPEPEPFGAGNKEEERDALEDTIREIDAFVSEAMEDENTVDESPTRRIEWTEEDEITTPRPKFDFSDLKFGTNYTEED